MAQRGGGRSRDRHQGIEIGSLADAHRSRSLALDELEFDGRIEVKQLVADRDAGAPGLACTTEHAERKVLDRKIGRSVVRTLDPTSARRVVSDIEIDAHVQVLF